MARYKPCNYAQRKFIPVAFEEQILPGTFEYTVNYLIDHELSLRAFDRRYRNDTTGASAYNPRVLLKIILYAYSRGILSSRRYAEVDPANRLVAATLEQRWNEALQRLSELKQQFEQAQREHARVATPEQKAQVLALARDFPRLWHAPTTAAKDRKRMLRLLIKDITAEKPAPKQVVLHIRWQGGACTDATVEMPPNVADKVRYPTELIERIRDLATTFTDAQIAESLNQDGRTSPKGKAFTASMIQWVRYRHRIPGPQLKHPHELTVDQMMEKFGVSRHVVYYWIERGHVEARQLKRGTPYWIRLDAAKEQALSEWVKNSSRISAKRDSETPL